MPIFYLFYLKQHSPKSFNLSSISSSSSPKSQINPSKPHKSPLRAFLCISTSPITTYFPFPRFCLLNRLQGLGWCSQCLSIDGIHYFWHADKLAIETNQVSRTKTVSLGRRYLVFAWWVLARIISASGRRYDVLVFVFNFAITHALPLCAIWFHWGCFALLYF